MLKYSDESKRLVSTFFAYRNDVDIYTEDQVKDKEFYRVLFSRLLTNIRINDITPLGSKADVINRCKEEPKGERKKVFIVDGDIALVNDVVIKVENLFVLDRYCIENFLIDQNSTCNFVYYNCGTKSKEEIQVDIDYDNWLKGYSEHLIDLFIHLAVLNFYEGKFTLHNVNKYHTKKKDTFSFDSALVQKDISDLKDVIIAEVGEEKYESKLNELRGKWTNSIETLLTIVSGKDYLIPMLLIKTQEFKSSKGTLTLQEAKIKLVQDFDVSSLNRLKEFIES